MALSTKIHLQKQAAAGLAPLTSLLDAWVALSNPHPTEGKTEAYMDRLPLKVTQLSHKSVLNPGSLTPQLKGRSTLSSPHKNGCTHKTVHMISCASPLKTLLLKLLLVKNQ